VIGPAVPCLQAAVSARRAFATHKLLEEGVLPPNGLVLADDQIAALIVHGDPGLLDDLAEQRLAPLADETDSSRARLSRTLLAWLDHQGRVPEIAAALNVHPQTVRYRLGRLRELFGPQLDDPRLRFELALALRAVPAR
jgi:DNA-binding PucR family transcriptional regulator